MNIINKIKRAFVNAFLLNEYKEEIKDNNKEIQKHLFEAKIFNAYILTRQRYEISAMHSTDKGTTDELYNGEEIVVSLTTYSKRLQSVYLVIESLFEQTYKANHVVLYISNEYNDNNIPSILLKQKERGLEIKYVEDIRSLTKLVYALEDYPNSNIITADDDYLYPVDHLENIIKGHFKYPKSIVCRQAKEMVYNKNNHKFTPYTTWNVPFENKPRMSEMFLHYGSFGTLYPANSLHEDVFNKELFLKLTPKADDIWFKIMALKKGTEIILLPHNWNEPTQGFNNDSIFWQMKYCQDIALGNDNVIGGENDTQLDAICNYYNLYEYFDNL